jgi:hypothetical protein
MMCLEVYIWGTSGCKIHVKRVYMGVNAVINVHRGRYNMWWVHTQIALVVPAHTLPLSPPIDVGEPERTRERISL